MRCLRTSAACLGLVVLTACRRYEYHPPSCPPEPSPRATSELRSAPGALGRVTGIIVDADRGTAVGGARVILEPIGRVVGTAESGAFSFDSVPPGAYRLTIRRVGYNARHVDAVHVSDTAGVTARLSVQVAPTDGCPAFMVVRVRRPWGKWG